MTIKYPSRHFTRLLWCSSSNITQKWFVLLQQHGQLQDPSYLQWCLKLNALSLCVTDIASKSFLVTRDINQHYPGLCWNWVTFTLTSNALMVKKCVWKTLRLQLPGINELKLWESSKIQNNARILFCFCAFMTILIHEWFWGTSTNPPRPTMSMTLHCFIKIYLTGRELSSLPFLFEILLK